MFKWKKAMEQKIDELEKRVAELEREKREEYDRTHPKVMGRRS